MKTVIDNIIIMLTTLMVGICACSGDPGKICRALPYSVGCVTQQDTLETIIENVRVIALEGELTLSKEELDEIKLTMPRWSYHQLAGSYSEYSFEWRTDKSVIMVRGRGDIYKLDGAEVVRLNQSQLK